MHLFPCCETFQHPWVHTNFVHVETSNLLIDGITCGIILHFFWCIFLLGIFSMHACIRVCPFICLFGILFYKDTLRKTGHSAELQMDFYSKKCPMRRLAKASFFALCPLHSNVKVIFRMIDFKCLITSCGSLSFSFVMTAHSLKSGAQA